MTENLLRLAIQQRHAVEAGEIIDQVAVELGQPPTARATVYLFAVRSRRRDGHCFAWVEDGNATTTIIHTAMMSPAIADAGQAVRRQDSSLKAVSSRRRHSSSSSTAA